MPTFIAIVTPEEPTPSGAEHSGLIDQLLSCKDAVEISKGAICFDGDSYLTATFDKLCEAQRPDEQFVLLRVNGGKFRAERRVCDGLDKLLIQRGPERTVSEPTSEALLQAFDRLRTFTTSLSLNVDIQVPYAKAVLDGKGQLPANCPSRNCAALMELGGVEEKLDEVNAAVADIKKLARNLSCCALSRGAFAILRSL